MLLLDEARALRDEECELLKIGFSTSEEDDVGDDDENAAFREETRMLCAGDVRYMCVNGLVGILSSAANVRLAVVWYKRAKDNGYVDCQ